MAAPMTPYKLVILGDSSVGKTALIIRLCTNHFVEEYNPTIEDSYKKRATIDGQSCIVEILDTAGQEEYTHLQDRWIRGGDGFVLVYSTSSRLSFTRIQEYHHQIQQVKGLASSPSSRSPLSAPGPARPVPVMLVGNKSDRVTEREVSMQEGHALAKHLGCGFIEASAKNNINVEKPFIGVVRLLRPQRQQSVQQLPSRTGTGIGGKKCVII